MNNDGSFHYAPPKKGRVFAYGIITFLLVILFINVVIWFHAGVITGVVISKNNGNMEIRITEGGTMYPVYNPHRYESSIDSRRIVFLGVGHYAFWNTWKVDLGDEIRMRCLPQKISGVGGDVHLTAVQTIGVVTPVEEAQGPLFPDIPITENAPGEDFAALIHKFNNGDYIDDGNGMVAGKLEEQADSPWYCLIYTGQNKPKKGSPFMTLFTVETKNGKTKATAEQYEYAEVDYKADNHADMVFSHDNQTEALRIPLW